MSRGKQYGKFITTVTNSIAIGVLLTTISSTDISVTRTAHWQVTASNICNCTDPELGVFDMKVDPLVGNAPLTVKMTGAKLTKENKEAYYRWSIFHGADTLVSTMYTQEYTYTDAGTYRIQVRGRDYSSRNTTKEYTITVNAATAVDNTFERVAGIFPNPVYNELNISGIAEGETITIYSLQGKLIVRQVFTGDGIPVDQLPAGVYLLRCKGYSPVKLFKK